MNELILVLIFLFFGFSAGIFIGMLGIGGGIIFVPALYFLLPYSGVDQSVVPYFAIGTSLCAGAMATSLSSWFQLKAKNVDKKRAFFIASGSAIAALILPFFVTNVDATVLKLIFSILLFSIAVRMLFENKQLNKRTEALKNWYLPAVGLGVGTIAAFAGLGGGVFYFPILVYLLLLEPRRAVGTSNVIVAITMLSGTISYFIQNDVSFSAYQIGFVYLAAAVPLGIGAVFGAKIGVNLALKINNSMIKKIFSVLLIIVVIKIILNLW